MVDAPRDQAGKYPVTPGDRLLYHLAVVRRSRNDRDAPFERVKLGDTLFSADPNHLITPVERMAHHVSAKLTGCADDANFHERIPLISPGRSRPRPRRGGPWCRRPGWGCPWL